MSISISGLSLWWEMAEKFQNKKFIGINFQCCNVYKRIYINKDKNAYEGNCPKCYRKVKVLIGANGTDQRFFDAH